MAKFLLWCILLVLCWPLALLALLLYPVVWLLLLPFRLVGIAVGGALDLVSAIIFLRPTVSNSVPSKGPSHHLSPGKTPSRFSGRGMSRGKGRLCRDLN